jgi:hypothetical protein
MRGNDEVIFEASIFAMKHKIDPRVHAADENVSISRDIRAPFTMVAVKVIHSSRQWIERLHRRGAIRTHQPGPNGGAVAPIDPAFRRIQRERVRPGARHIVTGVRIPLESQWKAVEKLRLPARAERAK